MRLSTLQVTNSSFFVPIPVQISCCKYFFPGNIVGGVYAAETAEEDLSLLPDATQLEPHVPTLSGNTHGQEQKSSILGQLWFSYHRYFLSS
jgi:hypothetical protein